MKVKSLYRELLITSILLNLFDAVLTGVAAFALGYLIVYFYRLEYIYGVIPAVILFLRSLYLKIRQNKILLLEQKYPDLRERLRTSFDHQERENTVVNYLHLEIVSTMKKVDVNAFLNMKKLWVKVISIATFLIAVLYLSSVGFDVLDVSEAVVNSPMYKKAAEITNVFDGGNQVDEREQLNEPRLIVLGDKELNVTISTFNTELDIQNIEDAEKNDYGGHYPEEIQGAAQESYEEGIPEEHREIVKEYFNNINK